MLYLPGTDCVRAAKGRFARSKTADSRARSWLIAAVEASIIPADVGVAALARNLVEGGARSHAERASVQRT